MSPTSHSIAAGELKVHYLEAGTGRPLVLLHGGTATSASWNAALPRLAENFHVFAPDLRGHGRTTNPGTSLGYDQMADDLAAFLTALALPEPLLLGYSDGGQILLEFALRHPGRAAALILGGVVSEPTEAYRDVLATWGFPAPGAVDLEQIAAVFGPHLDYIRTAHGDGSDPDYWRRYLGQMSSLWHGLPRYDASRLAGIATPTLIISGDRDQLAGPEQALRLYRLLPQAELAILPAAEHDAVEQELFWTVVTSFLARLSAPDND